MKYLKSKSTSKENLSAAPAALATKKLTLVLDLDETLIHSWHLKPESYDFPVDITNEDKIITLYVKMRPFLLQFLKYAAQRYELVLYTASSLRYATEILSKIDPYRTIFTEIYTRENCIQQNGKFMKNLELLGKDMQKLVMIDNDTSCLVQLENLIQVSSWLGDQKDQQLLGVLKIMQLLTNYEDIRQFIASKT